MRPYFMRKLPTRTWAGSRNLSMLTSRLAELVPKQRQSIAALRKEHGSKTIGNVTVNQIIGGMRGIPALLTETSLLDADEGIRFRGFSIPELQNNLPKRKPDSQPLSEGLLWLLMTGELPTLDQAEDLCQDLHNRSRLPSHIIKAINNFPTDIMHPMTQLSSAILALQTESKFAKAYERGISKTDYWKYCLDDSLDLVAKLPEVAARIYRNTFQDGSEPSADKSLDWSANFAQMLGFKDDEPFADLIRLYMNIHSDHEGGNVSAHTVHLVGSALSDPYLSFSAGINGLAGPLHGLANQEVLRWIKHLRERLGEGEVSLDELKQAVWDTLNSGKVIPGYGHAVLRQTDPRYLCQREFALKHMPDDPLFKLVRDLYEVVPEILKQLGKVSNPYPNVDAHSGVLLSYYGLTQDSFYTVLFGVSRSLGVLSSLVTDRILGLPIERPKSLTSALLREMAKQS